MTELEDVAERLLGRIKKGATLSRFQREAIRRIDATDRNILVVAPTGSGKTIIGAAALARHGRGFYLAPLRSLMREKYVELMRMFPRKKIVLTNKDYSVSRKTLKEADIRVMSPYKFILYLDWLEPGDGVVVVDEIHKISGDSDMEAAVTAMIAEGFRIVALSATIRKDDIPKMSRWLDAEVIVDRGGRPVPLRFTEVSAEIGPRLTVVNGGGYLPRGSSYSSKDTLTAELSAAILAKDPDGNVMVWAPTRRSADTLARLIASRLPPSPTAEAVRVARGNEHDRVLAYTIQRGVGIHHGGLSPRNRELVEDLFRRKIIRIVVSCYTLSHGVNMPVRHLVFSTLFDFRGMPLDPSTFRQIAGRAGRPGLDNYGEVVVVTVGELEHYLLSRLLTADAAAIRSKIHNRWTLTKIAAQRLAVDRSVDGFMSFLRRTYYAYERGRHGVSELMALAEEVLADVVRSYFVDLGGGAVEPRGRAEEVAAKMGLHPREWMLSGTLSYGGYDEAVAEAVSVAAEFVGTKDSSSMDDVVTYGLLAIYLGKWRSRELAEATQTILDAVTLYVRRIHGWGSPEFRNAREIAERFAYGGNPNAKMLAEVLRHDELKRLVRNMPKLFVGEIDPDELEKAAAEATRIVFEFKKRIYRKRVFKLADAVARAVCSGQPSPSDLERARRAALEEATRIAREYGGVVA